MQQGFMFFGSLIGIQHFKWAANQTRAAGEMLSVYVCEKTDDGSLNAEPQTISVPSEQVAPVPGNARITIAFNSPIASGGILVTVDGATLAEIPFDFTTKGLFGARRGGTGAVKRVVLVPSGRHSITAALRDGEGALRGSQTFDRELPANSDWTLRFDLPSKDATATVFLVRVSG